MIDESLKEKISANEQKLKSLFNLKKNIIKKTSNKINPPNKISQINLNSINNTKNVNIKKEKINAFINSKENQKNLINLDLSQILNTNINLNTKLINYTKFKSFLNPTINDNNKDNKNINNNKKPQQKFKRLENYINKKSINNLPKKKKKLKNISKSQPNKIETAERTERTERLKRNNSISKPNNLDFTVSSFLQQKKMSKSFDFNLTYERFIENETKKNEKILQLKKSREKFEKKIFPHKPKINEKSKKLNKSITDNFLIRLENYKKNRIKKDEILKKNILKDEEERINKNNFLIKHKKLKKKRLNDSMDKIYNNKDSITESVNKLFDWDKKRKERLENEIKKLNLIEKNGHIPKINKTKIFKKDKIIKKIFDRLYNQDKYMFEFKKQLLTQESTPKFYSFLNKTKSQKNISYNMQKLISSNSNDNIKEKEEDDKVNIETDLTINNNEKIKTVNNTERIINKNNYKNKPYTKEKQSKNMIVVIRKVKSQKDILNKDK